MSFLSGALASGEDWCFSDINGTLIDDPDAEWVQSLKLGGYFNYQGGIVDGRAGGQDFWYERPSEMRRARLLFSTRLLDFLDLSLQTNMVDDERDTGGGLELDYASIYTAKIGLDLEDLFDVPFVDSLTLAYGKEKLSELHEEIDTAANSLLTVERSALANQIAPLRGSAGITGGWLGVARGDNHISLGVYSAKPRNEFADWGGATITTASWYRDWAEQLGFDTAKVSIGGGYQNAKASDERYVDWQWVFSPWLRFEDGCWGFRASAAIAENEGRGRGIDGAFYGITVLPSWWLIEGRLQAVARYTLTKSEGPRGVLINSRYAREAGLEANEAIPEVATGRGDFHQAVYGGLDWTICPKRLTVQTGLEWEQLKSRDRSVYRGTTFWLGTRVVF